MKNPFEHFYKRSYRQRFQIIRKLSHLTSAQSHQIISSTHGHRVSGLIENYLTDYSLPEGIAVGLKINGRIHAVPMVVEEPSVIAAASNGAGMLSSGAGIHARVLNRLLTGQIILKISNLKPFRMWLFHKRHFILRWADQAHPTIKKYGGGARDLKFRHLTANYYSLDLLVNVSEAMGANIMNSMLEAVARLLDQRWQGLTLMSILSNYADHSLVRVTSNVPFTKLQSAGYSGRQVAERIALASRIAQVDIHRAATHNKGIMNGIDAVVIAMGNDWRAIESGIQAYAARHGRYQGISQWQVNNHGLQGQMTLPLPLGYVGGATRVLPLVKINQKIAGVHSAKDLMKLVASLGLAQNLAALKAIVTDGIQRGHMALQMRSLAVTAGADPQELSLVTDRLRQLKHPDLKDAKQIVRKIRNKQVNK